jgi:cytochrome c oxidase subunit 4
MSTTHVEVEEHEHDHPSDMRYVKIALILGALTALEVSTYFFNLSTAQLVILLFPMMIIKFAIVAAYFMHLKFDNKIFRRAFITGIVLAVFVYVAALTTFQFWSDGFKAANH